MHTGQEKSSDEQLIFNDIIKVSNNIESIYDNIKNSPVKRSSKSINTKKIVKNIYGSNNNSTEKKQNSDPRENHYGIQEKVTNFES